MLLLLPLFPLLLLPLFPLLLIMMVMTWNNNCSEVAVYHHGDRRRGSWNTVVVVAVQFLRHEALAATLMLLLSQWRKGNYLEGR